MINRKENKMTNDQLANRLDEVMGKERKAEIVILSHLYTPEQLLMIYKVAEKYGYTSDTRRSGNTLIVRFKGRFII
jgi:hypothetical protein